MAEIWEPISRAFRYAFSLKRMLPFFLINLVVLAGIIILINSAAALLPQFFSSSMFLSLLSLLPSLFAGVVIAATLVKLFFAGAIIDNASKFYRNKKVPLRRSFETAKNRYPSMLGASVLVAMIVTLAGLVPGIGFIISIALSWLFLFVLQFTVLSGANALGSVKKSCDFFMRRKTDTFLFWLAVFALNIFLSAIALLPVILALVPIMPAIIDVIVSGGSIALIFEIIRANIPSLAVGGFFSALILSYVDVFKESAKTFFFMQFRKK